MLLMIHHAAGGNMARAGGGRKDLLWITRLSGIIEGRRYEF